MHHGKILKELFHKNDLSLSKAAYKLGKARSTVQLWTQSEQLNQKAIDLICSKFDVGKETFASVEPINLDYKERYMATMEKLTNCQEKLIAYQSKYGEL